MQPGGRPLHRLVTVDYAYMGWNKIVAAFFVSHYFQWLLHGPHKHVVVGNDPLDFSGLTWFNLVIPVIANFFIYDLLYAPFHRFLHWTPIYPYIHKHHHRHLSPHRGLDDAINTHPFEMLIGAYIHLWGTALLDYFGLEQHIVAVIVYVQNFLI